jgi:glycosyltransferase involved in cell wall biosynthesis
MEAMALRRPVLTTSIAGIPELVRDGRDGWLFAAGSVEALCRAMEEFLATPAQDLAHMGESARITVLARHSIDTEAAKLVRLFVRPPVGEPVEA